MPNTLAHIGLQVSATKAVAKDFDVRLVLVGCLIPDLPWILQRLLNVTPLDVLDVRAYTLTMASPFFCTIFALGFGLFFKRWMWVFAGVSIQCLLHLLLDGLQDKKGAGVHWFAPFNWTEFSFPIFPMEGWIIHTASILGICVSILILWLTIKHLPKWRISSMSSVPRIKGGLIITLFGIYTLLPLALLDQPINANVHNLAIWERLIEREGKQIRLDRCQFAPGSPAKIKDSLSKDWISISGIDLKEPATVSLIATFIKADQLRADSYFVHTKGLRSFYTMIGLGFILLIFLSSASFRKELKE